MDAALEQRIAANEALFRQINERIEQGHWPGEEHVSLALRCECARLGCNEMLDLPPRGYEEVREHPRRFIVKPGHEVPEAENVVARSRGYLVVEKFGTAGQVAEETYTRA
jgi:hypothetical protein